MLKFYTIILIASVICYDLFSMSPNNRQILFCIVRREYDKQYHTVTKFQENPICPFCDQKSLLNNFILKESEKDNTRTMMNKFPYPDLMQGHHLLVMPISHQTHPSDFSPAIADAIQFISATLHDGAYNQVRWINWGKQFSGQSVDHIHEQFINFITPPLSVTEGIEFHNNSSITTIEQAFEVVKQKLDREIVLTPKPSLSCNSCLCCCIGTKKTIEDDKKNLIFFRGKHNFIGLSQYPSFAAEISVVPYNHVSAIKDLTKEAWRENALLAKAILPKMQEYAAKNIRECDGGNICTISAGAKVSEIESQTSHLYTIVAPRTSIQPTPDAMLGHSCIYMCDPEHLYDYLLSIKEQFLSIINKEE